MNRAKRGGKKILSGKKNIKKAEGEESRNNSGKNKGNGNMGIVYQLKVKVEMVQLKIN